jgi:hypothetical protein
VATFRGEMVTDEDRRELTDFLKSLQRFLSRVLSAGYLRRNRLSFFRRRRVRSDLTELALEALAQLEQRGAFETVERAIASGDNDTYIRSAENSSQ